jgi:hypothetical protein
MTSGHLYWLPCLFLEANDPKLCMPTLPFCCCCEKYASSAPPPPRRSSSYPAPPPWLSSWNEDAPAARNQRRAANQHTAAAAELTSNPDVRQVARTPSPLRLVHAAAVFPRHRIRREFELLSDALRPAARLHALLLLLLLCPLLRGGSGVLQVQLADLSLGLLLRESACPGCYIFLSAGGPLRIL